MFRFIKKINFLFCDNNSIRYLIYVILYFLLPKLSVIVTVKLQNMCEVYIYIYILFSKKMDMPTQKCCPRCHQKCHRFCSSFVSQPTHPSILLKKIWICKQHLEKMTLRKIKTAMRKPVFVSFKVEKFTNLSEKNL